MVVEIEAEEVDEVVNPILGDLNADVMLLELSGAPSVL